MTFHSEHSFSNSLKESKCSDGISKHSARIRKQQIRLPQNSWYAEHNKIRLCTYTCTCKSKKSLTFLQEVHTKNISYLR